MRPAARQEGYVLPALRRQAAAGPKEKMDRISRIESQDQEIDRINMINKIKYETKVFLNVSVSVFRSNPVNLVNPVYCF
jgi:hypothetical protein